MCGIFHTKFVIATGCNLIATGSNLIYIGSYLEFRTENPTSESYFLYMVVVISQCVLI